MPTLPVQIDPTPKLTQGPYQAPPQGASWQRPSGKRRQRKQAPAPWRGAGTTCRVSKVTRFVGGGRDPLWRLGRRCDVGTFECAGPVVAAGAIERAQPRFDGEPSAARGAHIL